ncbi:MAG: helix-turn-helix transcriptional regulator [Anaerolineales bacterium]|nr:helix-turn-helix transcriptional regulator [Anaerolineales bacterium]
MGLWNSPAQLFKLLGHPARLAILNILREGEQCVCHLEAVLGYRQAYISQHLMGLREAGLVQDRREGPNVFYRVAEPAIFRVIDAANPVGEPAAVPTARPAECPCPKCQPVAEPMPA